MKQLKFGKNDVIAAVIMALLLAGVIALNRMNVF
jgi:hypothetical protein